MVGLPLSILLRVDFNLHDGFTESKLYRLKIVFQQNMEKVRGSWRKTALPSIMMPPVCSV
jgi:hypothetical protein